MRFELCGNFWICHFYDKDRQKNLQKVLHFADAAKIRELARRSKALKVLEDHQALELGISGKKGALDLHLDGDQYAKLLGR